MACLRVSNSWFCERLNCRTLTVALLTLVAVPVSLNISAVDAAVPYEVEQTPTVGDHRGIGPTWLDSMLDAREQLMAEEAAGDRPTPKVVFHSEIVRGMDPARAISVPTRGVEDLYLYVTGAPEVVYGAGDWANPVFVDRDGKAKSVTATSPIDVQQGYHTVNCSLRSRVNAPLMIAGQEYERGINIQAQGKIRVKPIEGTVRFESLIGIDDWVNPATYKLPQPFYYQPHLFSTKAVINGGPDVPEQPNGAIRFHVVDAAGAARIDLWSQLEKEFSDGKSRREMKWAREDRIFEEDWTPGDWGELAERYAKASYRVPRSQKEAIRIASEAIDRKSFHHVRKLYLLSRSFDDSIQQARDLDFEALRLAIEDLIGTHGDAYVNGRAYLEQLNALRREIEKQLPDLGDLKTKQQLDSCKNVVLLVGSFNELKKDALLANPLLDFDRLLMVRRTPHGDPRRAMGRGYGVGEYIGLPRQSSKHNPGIEQPMNWENDVVVLSPISPDGELRSLYRSEDRRLVKDVDLNWDGDKLLFSMPGSHNNWHVFEYDLNGNGDGNLKQLTPTDQPGVHFYDPCWLPSDEIAMVSTAPMQGVPCNAGVVVGMMYKMDADGANIRQLAFEQDHTYCPTVTNDGRILYLRWDYTDTPHVWNRILMTMNPDGTAQTEFYGSNSYWPNSLFYARSIPGKSNQFVGIVTGHHYGRVGDLTIFDQTLGRHETSGVVQQIPRRGKKVEPLVEDKLTDYSWPKFVNPWPLDEKYFIVSCKPTPDSLWGVYLVDVFDNMVLLHEEETRVLLEPIPLRKSVRPRVIPDRVIPESDEATVYLADVYAGAGLKDVPRGTVKKLRIFTYHFVYQKMAGINHRVGADGPWEVKKVLGTVPVEEDGSASFRVPAKLPISIQPLDAEGKAVQLMRSWMTLMPGETLSCVGCHENKSEVPSSGPGRTTAGMRMPSTIEPWYGAPRGFSFQREVQPVLDKFCVGCHDGSTDESGGAIADLRADQPVVWAYAHGRPDLIRCENMPIGEVMKKYNGIFPPSYVELRKYVRVGGLESDLHMLPPMEFHADTSPLIQILQQGHHGVELPEEAWDRLVTWIDLNAPCHGSWSEFTKITSGQDKRRLELRQLYGGIDEDDEVIVRGDPPFGGDSTPVTPVRPTTVPQSRDTSVIVDNTPEKLETRVVDLGDDITIEMVRIPSVDGAPSFWIARTEVTNRQYAQFDREHDSRFEHRGSWIFSEEYLGWPLDAPNQPVVRVSCDEAARFCRWLSDKSGLDVKLPTEQQWEHACRAGAKTPFWFGAADADYTQCENLADRSIKRLADECWGPKPPDLAARDDRFNDGTLVTAEVGSYRANRFGLHDMHGNVREWTSSEYAPSGTKRTVRGGSWRDMPERCTASSRFGYQPYQKVHNVGFRIISE